MGGLHLTLPQVDLNPKLENSVPFPVFILN